MKNADYLNNKTIQKRFLSSFFSNNNTKRNYSVSKHQQKIFLKMIEKKKRSK